MSFLFKLNRYILEFYCEFKRQLRLQKIQKLSAVLDGLLNAKSGVEGELALIRGVKNALTELNVNHITHIDYGLKDAVLVFKNNTSYEYDLIVLTEIGLYVFEAKNWWGEVKLSNQSGKLELNQFQKGTFLRSDPSETNHKKMRALVKPIGQSIYCFAPVVFTNLETKLDSNIPNHILHINNLGSFFEQEFEAAKRSNREKLSVQDLSKEIFCQLDHDLRAKHFHMMRMPETEENSVKLYHETQAKIDELEKSIAEIKVADYSLNRILKDFVLLIVEAIKTLWKKISTKYPRSAWFWPKWLGVVIINSWFPWRFLGEVGDSIWGNFFTDLGEANVVSVAMKATKDGINYGLFFILYMFILSIIFYLFYRFIIYSFKRKYMK